MQKCADLVGFENCCKKGLLAKSASIKPTTNLPSFGGADLNREGEGREGLLEAAEERHLVIRGSARCRDPVKGYDRRPVQAEDVVILGGE